MINVDVSIKVENVETLLEHLEHENGSGLVYEHSGFLDLHEPEILNDRLFKHLQFKKYAYAVRNVDDTFLYESDIVERNTE